MIKSSCNLQQPSFEALMQIRSKYEADTFWIEIGLIQFLFAGVGFKEPEKEIYLVRSLIRKQNGGLDAECFVWRKAEQQAAHQAHQTLQAVSALLRPNCHVSRAAVRR